MTTAYDFSAQDIDGRERSLSEYQGKALLIVNVASRCGFTPQYKSLEALHARYAERGLAVLGFPSNDFGQQEPGSGKEIAEFGPQGLVVLGFPCDQFGHQEPGDEAEIRNFCSLNYDVSFPLFAKIDVNGDGAHPLWKWLKQEKSGLLGISAIKWNFSKFLVGRDGRVIKRYAPTDTPESIAGDIRAALG